MKKKRDCKHMGHFTAIGMRDDVSHVIDAFVVDTCCRNDTSESGDDRNWTWSNPTNRAIVHEYEGVSAVSVEALWQGTKSINGQPCPDPVTLAGAWRRGKAKRPQGAYAGPGQLLITSPGEARRRIYLPAYRRLVEHWIQNPEIAGRVRWAKARPGPVFLRDWDTGRGVDQDGPMSHAWVLAMWLNTGVWPS